MRARVALSVSVSLAVGAVGCSRADTACRCSTGVLAISGPQNSHPAVTEQGADFYLVDFGAVAVGSEIDGSLTFENTGNSPLAILSVSAPSDAEFSLTLMEGISIQPGAVENVPISFKPFSAGAKSGMVVLEADSPSTPTVTLNLIGTGGI